MSAHPHVVACMPARNGERFVDATLASLASQTYPNLEVLISDDASTDATAEICARYAASDSRFRLVQQTRRLGWIGNANCLLDAARGTYAFFAFHDDPLEPAYVTRLVEALEARPTAVLAFSDMHAWGGVLEYRELEDVTDRVERARRVIRRCGHWWIPHRGVFRLQAARTIGGLRRHLAGEYEADHPWTLRLAMAGEFVRVPEPLVHKAFGAGTLSAIWNRKPRPWQSAAVLLAAAREVRRARPPLAEEIALHKELARFAAWALVNRRVF